MGLFATAGSATPPQGLISSNANNPFTNLSTNPLTAGQFAAANTDCNPATAGVAVNGGNLSFNDLGQLVPAANGGLCAFADRASGSSRYNFNPVNYLVTPYDRFGIAATSRYDITDYIRLKVVANYVDSQQTVNLAPTPATGLSVPVTNAFIAIGIAGPTSAGGNGAPCGVGVSCNPDLLAALNSRPNPTAPFTYARRFFETGPRVGIYNSKTQSLRGTLSGPIGWGFNWDATGSYGKTTANIEARGNINNTAVREGLANCPAPALPGCVPIDIFGANTLFPGYDLTGLPGSPVADIAPGAQLAFVRIDTQERREFEQVRVAGNITGNLFELPAGPVGLAIGAEVSHRQAVHWPSTTPSGPATSSASTRSRTRPARSTSRNSTAKSAFRSSPTCSWSTSCRSKPAPATPTIRRSAVCSTTSSARNIRRSTG